MSVPLNLTILMPCLNEEANIAFCIEQAKNYIASRKLTAEILVVDNNSTDQSAEIAVSSGATVIREIRRGYGRALRTGLSASQGNVIIFGDCDSTYDFLNLEVMGVVKILIVCIIIGGAAVMLGWFLYKADYVLSWQQAEEKENKKKKSRRKRSRTKKDQTEKS